jgi:flagellar protein FliO/FliZ
MSVLIRLAFVLVVTLAVPGLTPAQESAPGNAVAEQLAQSSLRMVGSMFAVLVLVAVCAWALRRWRDRQGVDGGSIEIVSGISLGSKERIVLLKVGDEQVLVGVSPAGMRSLHVVTQANAERVAAETQSTESAPLPTRPVKNEFDLSLGAAR